MEDRTEYSMQGVSNIKDLLALRSSRGMSRRDFLIAAGGGMVMGTALFALDKKFGILHNLFTRDHKSALEVTGKHIGYLPPRDRLKSIQVPENPPPLDLSYLKGLIDYLEQSKGTSESRMETIVNHLFHLSVSGMNATALMIDESGIFLAPAHVLGGEPFGKFHPIDKFSINVLTHPSTSQEFMIRQFMIMPGIDTAIVYAPTGRKQKPIDIQIDTAPIEEGRILLGHAIVREETKDLGHNYYLVDVEGKKINLREKRPAYEELIIVKDLIPFGGFSGGPVFDVQGKVVGTESGPFPTGALKREDYKGATIASIMGLKQLMEKGSSVIYSVPGLEINGLDRG